MEEEQYQKFGRYLFGELMWELEQCGISISELQGVQKEDIEVLFVFRYKILRFRVNSTAFCAHLTWRGDIAPSVERIPTNIISPSSKSRFIQQF